MIAIGSQNGSIYLFRVSRDGFTCKKLSKIRGTQPLMQLDWSCDNNFIQTVTADYDLAYCKRNDPLFSIYLSNDDYLTLIRPWRFVGDVKGAIQEKSHIAMKDIKWSTLNCTVGYLIAGEFIIQCIYFVLKIIENIPTFVELKS